jgi:hypothetical protein
VAFISRAIATARARASLAFRDCERVAEYNRLDETERLVCVLEPFVAASAEITEAPRRPESASVPIQKIGFLLKWRL